jgi:hypothetical protein
MFTNIPRCENSNVFSYLLLIWTYCITIDVLLILKVRKKFFFFRRENIYWGISRGPRPFSPLNCGQKGQSPLEKSQEMPHYMLCQQNKNNIPHFQNQQNIGIFMSHTDTHTPTHHTPKHPTQSHSVSINVCKIGPHVNRLWYVQ